MPKKEKIFGFGSQKGYHTDQSNAPNLLEHNSQVTNKIYDYLNGILQEIYYTETENSTVQYCFNMHKPHYLALLIQLILWKFDHEHIFIKRIKEFLTCSDRQADIMIDTLHDKKFINKIYEDLDKRICCVSIEQHTEDDIVDWAILHYKRIYGTDLTLKSAHHVR